MCVLDLLGQSSQPHSRWHPALTRPWRSTSRCCTPRHTSPARAHIRLVRLYLWRIYVILFRDLVRGGVDEIAVVSTFVSVLPNNRGMGCRPDCRLSAVTQLHADAPFEHTSTPPTALYVHHERVIWLYFMYVMCYED